jgi:hypothetical protein
MKTDDKIGDLKDTEWHIWYEKFQVRVGLQGRTNVIDEDYKPTTTRCRVIRMDRALERKGTRRIDVRTLATS